MKKIEAKMERNGLTMETDVNTFALALKTWRLRQNLTQKQVGEQFGLSRFTIMRIEQAKPVSWETAYRAFAKLSEALSKESSPW